MIEESAIIVLSIKQFDEKSLFIQSFSQDHGLLSGYYKIPNVQRNLNYISILHRANAKILISSEKSFVKYCSIEKNSNFYIGLILHNTKFLIVSSIIHILLNVLHDRDIYFELWNSFHNFLIHLSKVENKLELFLMYILFEIRVLQNLGVYPKNISSTFLNSFHMPYVLILLSYNKYNLAKVHIKNQSNSLELISSMDILEQMVVSNFDILIQNQYRELLKGVILKFYN